MKTVLALFRPMLLSRVMTLSPKEELRCEGKTPKAMHFHYPARAAAEILKQSLVSDPFGAWNVHGKQDTWMASAQELPIIEPYTIVNLHGGYDEDPPGSVAQFHETILAHLIKHPVKGTVLDVVERSHGWPLGYRSTNTSYLDLWSVPCVEAKIDSSRVQRLPLSAERIDVSRCTFPPEHQKVTYPNVRQLATQDVYAFTPQQFPNVEDLKLRGLALLSCTLWINAVQLRSLTLEASHLCKIQDLDKMVHVTSLSIEHAAAKYRHSSGTS